MIESDASSEPKPSLQRISSLDPNSLVNLDWQQEICDDISRFGRDKYVHFMELIAKDRLVSSRAISYLEQSPLRTSIAFLSTILGVISAALYIHSTYKEFGVDLPHQSSSECVMGIVLIAAFVILVVLDGMNYLWSVQGIMDLLTNWPSIIAIIFMFPLPRNNQFFYLSRLLRLLRLRYVITLCDKVSGVITRQILTIFATMLSLVVISAGVFQYHEFYDNHRYTKFHDDVYLMFMSITTVGAGDIRPMHVASRFMILMTVAVSFGMLPLQITHLIRLWSPDKTRTTSSSRASGQHVVVILPPEITVDEIDDFLGELFHSNHGKAVFAVVLLTSTRTNQILMQALRSRSYFRYLAFLSGSPYEDRDLQRSRMSSARAAFVLSRRSCETLDHENEEDMHALLAAVSVKNYCPAIPTIVQINNPQSSATVLWRNLVAFPNTQLLCVKQVKMALLAGSCVCPGLHVLVGNMLQSFVAKVDTADSWHKEYIWGATNDLIPTVFGSYFEGKRFLDAAIELYTAIDVMPIAVFKRSAQTQRVEILLSPIDHVIRDGDLVYVLSRDLKSASLVPAYPNHHGRHQLAQMTDKLKRCTDLAASFQMSKQAPLHFQMDSAPDSLVPLHISTSVSVQGHIVICGYIDGSVVHLIWALHKQMLSRAVPVVVILDSEPSRDLCMALSAFASLSVIVGSLQDPKTLESANLTSAAHILLLANPFSKAQGDVHNQVVNVDFDNVVSLLELENYLHSETHRASTNLTVEILFLSNLRFIRPNFSYSVAALNELKGGGGFKDMRLPQLAAADGKIHASGVLQSIAAFAFYSPHVLTILDALVYGTNREDHRRILLVSIPRRMIGEQYAGVVRRLAAEYGVLAIGLLRGRSVRRSPVPYVFTKPPANTVVCYEDRVYVLGTVDPKLKPPVIHKLRRSAAIVEDDDTPDADDRLPVIMSAYGQQQDNLDSSIHMFQQALRSQTMRKSQLFEPDLPAWFTRIRSLWRSATNSMDFSWMSQRREPTHEPHDYRKFMKERNQPLGATSTMTQRDFRNWVPRRLSEPFDYDDSHHVDLSGVHSVQMLSETVD